MENELIQKLLDFNPDAAFIADKKTGAVLLYNKVFKNESGLNGDDTKSIFDLILPREKDKIHRMLNCKSSEEEIHFRSGNGNAREYRISASEFTNDKLLCTFRHNKKHPVHPFRNEIYNKLNDAVIATDVDTNITAWNKAAELIYGWKEAEAVGKKLGSLTLSEMTESDRKLSMFELESKGSSRIIVTQRNKKGQPVFVESNTFVLRDNSGKINGYVSIIRDVTSRLETLEELKSSEERYRQLFYENPLPIIIYRQDDYLVLNINKTAVKKFGHTKKEFLNLKMTDLVRPEAMDNFKKVTGVKNQKEKREGIARLKINTGEIVFMEYSSTPIKYKGNDARLVVLNDITEKRKAEEDLYDSSAKLDTIVNNLPMVLLELDENGVFILQDGKALTDVGFKPGELIGKSAYDLLGDVMVTLHNGEFIPVNEVIPRVMKGEMVSGHTTLAGRHYDNYFVPLRNESEKVTGLLGICLDITERILLEKSYHQTEERFRLIAENTSELISMVSNKKYLYLSPSYESKLGYTPEELNKLGPFALVHPEDKQLLKNRQNKGMVEFRVRNKNGDWLWVESESFIISGDPPITVGIAKDITKRKLAQKALEDSEERYRILFQSSPLPIFVYDRISLKFLAANDVLINHYGFSEEELLGMSIKDIRREEDIPRLLDSLTKADPGLKKHGIWQHRKKNGEMIDVDITTHNILFKGTPARIVLANDVTEKVKAEKALIESEAKYRRIVENANEGIWLFNNKWQTTFVNKKFTNILGYKKKEMERKSIFEFISAADKDKAGRYLHKIRMGSRETIKLRFQHKDGTERWIISNAAPILSGDMVYSGALALITDITEQRKAEAILQRTNEMLNALINSSPLSIIILDKDGNIELWNPASEKMFGWHSSEVLGIKPPFVPREKGRESEAFMKSVLVGNTFTGKEVIRTRKDSRKINVSISASPLFDSNKKPIGIASFLMDITDRKLAEKEKGKLFKEISTARTRLKTLSSKLILVQENEKRNISRELHDEVGQILTAIKIDLERLKNSSSADNIPLVDDCTALVKKTISIVRNLSHELRPSIIDDLGLSAALRWYTDKFSQRTGIKVNLGIIGIDKSFPSGSAITLFRICQEALTNIAKHSHADYVRIMLIQEDGTIALSVEDNGRGFEVKKVIKLAARGKSLGLLSMQERVDGLGGKLNIISAKNSGTKIKISYQVKKRMKSIRVILADDHNLVRAGIKSLLEDSNGIIVIGEAANGRDAVKLTAELKPDIVVLDIAMPELNGLEASARIRKDYPAVKTLILSMYTDEEYIIHALKSGASGYLLKDSAPGELKTAVDTVMKGEIYISQSIRSEEINNYINKQKDVFQTEENIRSRGNLTSRQREVLQLIAEGNSTKEIAEKLFISVKTVETHRSQLMKKLGIYDIAGLVKYAIKIGLIFPER